MQADKYTRRVLALLLTAAGPAFAIDHTVQVGQNSSGTAANAFNPQFLTIASGDTVTFVNNSGGFHNAQSDDGTTFSSGGASFGLWTYTTPQLTATTGYHCMIHGSVGSGMFGTITVQVVPVRLQSFEVD
jgi:plastocyanin